MKQATDYKLIIFDMNGTLTNTPFVDHKPLGLLPGRLEVCQQLRADKILLAVASNQGGVAFGFQSEQQARAEVEGIGKLIDAYCTSVAFGHPSPKRGYEEYGTRSMLYMRKPEPGMLLSIMDLAKVEKMDTLMVGDRDEDSGAAAAAGVDFQATDEFFAAGATDAAHLLKLYLLFCDINVEKDLYLVIDTVENGGVMTAHQRQWYLDWSSKQEAISKLLKEKERLAAAELEI